MTESNKFYPIVNSEKIVYPFSFDISGDGIFQRIRNNEMEDIEQLTEENYNKIYYKVRNLIGDIEVYVKINTKRKTVEIIRIVDGLNNIYKKENGE